MHLGDSSVVCPLCMRAPVRMRQGILECGCGLHMDLRAEAWTLPQVGQLLAQVTEQHSLNCQAVPHFMVGRLAAHPLDGLHMMCSTCNGYWFVF